MRIKILPHGLLDSNCYILYEPSTKRGLVIDPGSQSAARILNAIQHLQLNIDYIILTHEHFDHSQFAEDVRVYYQAKIICSDCCVPELKNQKKNFSAYWGDPFSLEHIDLSVEALNYQLDWIGNQIRFLKTPGHTPGSICIAINNLLFTGDTLLNRKKKYAKIPGSDKTQQLASIKHLLASFSDQTMIFPGHGPRFKLGHADLNYI